ncbi:MAG: hypothetical protein ACLT1J_02815 [Mediterraneibacter gnavus]
METSETSGVASSKTDEREETEKDVKEPALSDMVRRRFSRERAETGPESEPYFCGSAIDAVCHISKSAGKVADPQ